MKHFLPMSLICLSLVAAGAQTPVAPVPVQPYTGNGEILGPFGIGGCNVRTRDKNFATWIPQMAAIGITTIRGLGGTGWSGQAERKFDTVDWQLEYLNSQGLSSGGGFYNYRSGAGKTGLPMDDLPGWSADVANLVTHFKGKIKYWEVWNEPPNGTAKGQTAIDYAKFVIATYDAAKKADPDCKIGIAAKSVALNYLDQALAAGARGHFDYITLHPYETAGMVTDHPGTELVYLQIAGSTRKMLAARDPSKIDCPIIFTELGYSAASKANHDGPHLQACALVKDYILGIAQGIACIQWFEGMDGDSGPMGLIDGRGIPRPACIAMAQMIKYFSQKPQYLGWVLLNNKHYAFVFQGAKDTVLVTWASSKEPDTVDFGQPVKIVDPLTAIVTESATTPLTLTPIMIDGVPEKLLAEAKGNKTKPFPWGGDYTDAKSVSVTMGETNVEKGLHTLSSQSVAAAVLAYGGSARVGTVPGGNIFIVDPNFLSYTATPIEITAMVRRDEANSPAQLELEYESTKGYKKLPVFQVPDNTEWHKATWRIDDPQFVAMWGFNFRFNSGKYVVQSVTVTKLGR